ncbi:MAG TPA: serine/threonine protein kinase, partial [Paludibacter sp.]
NVLLNYDKIPGIICRSTLRAKDAVGGYTIFSISDSIHVFEKKIGQLEDLWLAIPIETKKYDQPNTTLRSLNTTLSKQSVL